MSTVVRLTRQHQDALEALLHQDHTLNLFLLGFVREHPIDRGWWYATFEGDALTGAMLVLPGRLAVPYAPRTTDAVALGQAMKGNHEPALVVGERATVDALWEQWGAGIAVDRCYDQRLYVSRTRPNGPAVPGFRRAHPNEWKTIAEYSAAMEQEDLGTNPSQESPEAHEQAVRERIRAGRTWVIARDGDVLFQINVGTVTPFGAQVGGTYVPPRHRRQGLATAGMRALLAELLTRHGVVTLHVNEANTHAVRVYENVGMQRANPMRLITVGRREA